jgi:hypothetical protein
MGFPISYTQILASIVITFTRAKDKMDSGGVNIVTMKESYKLNFC